MRIALVAGYAPSLLNFRRPLMEALLARGHEVVALAPPCPPGEASAASAVEAGLRALGVRLVSYPLDRGGMNPARDLRTLLALKGLLRELRPELCLSYTIKPVVYASLAAHMAGVPRRAALVTGLGYAFGALGGDAQGAPLARRVLSGLALRLYRAGLARCHSVVFQNPDDRALFESLALLPAAARTAVVGGSGVDLRHFSPAPLPAPSQPPVFLCLARLLWAKGVGVYVDACRMLKKRHPQVVCRLVGGEDAVPDAVPQEAIRHWREEGLVELPGHVDDVRPELAAASVFVLPSFREGLPRACLEAMAMGRPVVTSDAPGCRQTVEDGVTGFLVPPFEPGALMRAMERFVLAPGLAAQMGPAARRLAEERFDCRRVAEDTMAALPLDPAQGGAP